MPANFSHSSEILLEFSPHSGGLESIPPVAVPSNAGSAGLSAPSSENTPWLKARTRCPICNIHILKKTLPRHIRSLHLSPDDTLKCLDCHQTFNRKDVLARHWREQHGPRSNSTICDICGDLIRTRALSGHRQSMRCRTADRAMAQVQASNSDSEVPRCNLLSQIGTVSMLDPLVVAASLHRLSLTILQDLLPKPESHPGYMHGVAPMALLDVLFCSGPVSSMRQQFRPPNVVALYEMNRTGLNSALLDEQFRELWKLRGLALFRTKDAMKAIIAIQNGQSPSSTQPIDDIIIQVMLLRAADARIFGDNSEERMSHNIGLIYLLEPTRRSQKIGIQFVSLLAEIWGGRRDCAVASHQSFGYGYTCNSVQTWMSTSKLNELRQSGFLELFAKTLAEKCYGTIFLSAYGCAGSPAVQQLQAVGHHRHVS